MVSYVQTGAVPAHHRPAAMSALVSRAAAAAVRRHWGARDGLSGFRGSTRIAENPHRCFVENDARGAFCSRSVSTSGTHMHFTSGDDDEGCTRERPGDKGLPIVYHSAYSKPVLPEGHRFPMPVFREIYRRLIRDGVAVPGANLYQPARMPSMEELLAAHDRDYVDAFRHGALDEKQMRKIGLPWSEALVERTLAEVAGTILTADLALATGLAVNCAGGTHHAHFDHGSGYCVFNDLAIAAKRVIQRKAVDRVLILDLDVHQGDGTARILSDEDDVFTLSVHCADNFPANKARSDRDVPLPKGTGDDAYVKTVEAALRETLQDFKPNLVLYDAGVDVHEADALGGLRVTDEGLIRREALVLDVCVGGGVPVAAFVGGGYDDDMRELVRRHCILHHVAREIYESNKM